MLQITLGGAKIRIKFGFLLLLSLFLLLDKFGLGLAFLEAVLLHEAGHLLLLFLLKWPLQAVELSLFGIRILPGEPRNSGFWGQLALYLAGPMSNVLCCIILLPWDKFRSLFHLILAAWNLLPIRPMDGGSACYLLAEQLWGPLAAERLLSILEHMVGIFLLLAGLWLLLGQLNPSLLLFAVLMNFQKH